MVLLHTESFCAQYHSNLIHHAVSTGQKELARAPSDVNSCCDMQRVRDGELMLMDAGCELHGYCSDVTRTWPVSGTYTKHQRAIYEIVLDAQRCPLPAEPPGPCALPSPAPDPSSTPPSAYASNAWKALSTGPSR